MFNTQLTQAVENFASLMLPLTEKQLENEWIWKDHDEEGIRFAFFVTLQELRQLAVTLSTLRPKLTPAQHILSQYHAAYLDLQSIMWGVSPDDTEKVFTEREWNLRRVYAHILGADINFTAAVRYALEGHRAGTWKPEQMSDEDDTRLVGMSEDEFVSLVRGPLDGMLSYHRTFHPKVIEDFSQITDAELDLPSTFWEETRFPIRHRLHRYEAHYTQHIIQFDKTLVAIGLSPNESKRLIRKVYAALAEAEGMMIGAEQLEDITILVTASSIEQRTKEIKKLLETA